MKKLFLLLSISLLTISCSSNDSETTTSLNSITYLGVLTGSSGYYSINLQENGTTSATITFDGTTYQLVSETYNADQALSDFKFTDGTNEIIINANADGSNPRLAFTIPGHTIQHTVNISTGENSVDLYEGTSTAVYGASFYNATYNLSLNNDDNSFTILEKVTDSSDSNQIGSTSRISGSFTKSNNSITFSFNSQSITGTLNQNTISGDDGNGFTFSFNKVN